MAGEFGTSAFGTAPFGGDAPNTVTGSAVGAFVFTGTVTGAGTSPEGASASATRVSTGVPLTVRIKTARTDRHIKADLHNLRFDSGVPGGYKSAQFTLNRPLRFQPDEVALYAQVYIYDERNGNTVWEGRLEDPGRGAGSQGEIYELTALGSSVHARDQAVAYVVMDTSLERWAPNHAISSRTADTAIDERDDQTATIFLRAQEGITVHNGWSSDMEYKTIWHCHQELARVSCTVVNGATTASWENHINTRLNNGAGTICDAITWTTTDTNMAAAKGGGTAIPDGHNVTSVRIQHPSASSVAGPLAWGEFFNIAVKAVLFNADGTEISSGYTSDFTLASSIVNDMLGRGFLPKYDGANASVEATTFEVRQAAWPDGATPAEIFDDLMLIHPTHYWAAWETNPATGKWRFEWRSWPTTVRYEADVIDGITAPGSAEGLYNKVRVRYTTPHGYTHFTTRTSTVPVLDDADLEREAFEDIGDEIGMVVAQANKVADEFLLEHQTPPNAGTLTIARPILDVDQGRMVMPWEIRPGHLIRVRGILPHRDSLNVTVRDGVTVYKIVSVSFDATSASATFELDAHTPTVARRLAELGKRKITRRR